MYRPVINRFLFVGLVSIYLLALCNFTFWKKAWNYSEHDMFFIVSTAILLFAVFNIILGSFAYKHLIKPAAIILVVVSGVSAYFADVFGTIIDRHMINNALETNTGEAQELLTNSLFIHLVLYVLLPVALILWCRITFEKFKKTYFQNVAFVCVSILAVGIIVLPSFSYYASITRNNRDLLKSLHPTQPIFSLIQVAAAGAIQKDLPLIRLGEDAIVEEEEKNRRQAKLTIVVLGETARAKSFSLNGYERETNPELKKHNVFSYSNVTSCGTATAISVPCMFSKLTKAEYSKSQANHTENVLDIIARAGVQVAWFDNNSDSKGQANRIPYFSVRKAKDEKYCNEEECFDEILISEMAKYVEQLKTEDTFIVLHQLGSHGPAYYKRVPQNRKAFFPECETPELNKCEEQQIINAYDNTIFYTDYFLGKVIEYLKSQEDRFDTSMLYVSDHGESTGEYGLYLHGMPYALAPESQTHVPMVLWLSEPIIQQEKIDVACMKQTSSRALSHDNIFHSLIELAEVETKEYDAAYDILEECADDNGEEEVKS